MVSVAAQSSGRTSTRGEKRIKTILVVCLVFSLLLFATTTLATVLFPYDWGYGEGPLLDQAARIAAGQTLYKADLDQAPFVIANYPPLYPLLMAAVSEAASLPMLQVGRAISLLAALVSGVVVGLLGRKLSGRSLGGLLAAVVFLANPFVLHWSRMARVDLLALALSLLALWLLFTRWRSWTWLAVSVLLLVGAVYTRQTYALAVPLAGTVWLWINDRKRATAFVLSLGVSCAAVFLLLNWATQGGFYLNIVAANVNPYLVTRTLAMCTLLLLFCPVLVTMTGFQVVRTLRSGSAGGSVQDSESVDPQKFLRYGMVAYAVGALLSALTIGKIGSHVNYFVELMAAVAVWAAVALPKGESNLSRKQLGVWVLMLVQVAWLLGVAFTVQDATLERWLHLDEYDRLYHEVETAAAEGPVLADDFMGMVVLAGQRLYLQPFEYQQLSTAGMWDQAGLIEQIEGHQFPLLVLSQPGSELYKERWGEAISTAIEANYEVSYTVGDLHVLRPSSIDKG